MSHNNNENRSHLQTHEHTHSGDVNIMNYKKNTLRDIERRQKLNEEIASEAPKSTATTVDETVTTATGEEIIGHMPQGDPLTNPREENHCEHCTKHASCHKHAQH